jgi:hypothetical protein
VLRKAGKSGAEEKAGKAEAEEKAGKAWAVLQKAGKGREVYARNGVRRNGTMCV